MAKTLTKAERKTSAAAGADEHVFERTRFGRRERHAMAYVLLMGILGALAAPVVSLYRKLHQANTAANSKP